MRIFGIQQRLYKASTALALGCVAILLGVQATLESRFSTEPVVYAIRGHDAPFPPRLLQWLSFGQLPVMIDSLWIRALQAGEVTAVKRLPTDARPQLFHDFDSLTELDPAHFLAYQTGVIFLTVVQRDPTGALKLVDKGLRFEREGLASYPAAFRQTEWQMAWNLHMLKAYLYMFEFSDMPRAAAEMVAAAAYPDVPVYLKGYEQRLAKPDGQYEVGMRVLNWFITNAGNPGIREGFEEQLRSLHVGQYLFNLNRDFGLFLAKIPEYRNTPAGVSPAFLKSYWSKFRGETDLRGQDPWGGELRLDPGTGRIMTTTPHQRVMGLE